MTTTRDKKALFEELVELVAADLDTADRAVRAAREGATHEEAKPENDKDTRALEQSYLAHGQAKRTEELRVALGQMRAIAAKLPPAGGPIALGSLVEADEDGATVALPWHQRAVERRSAKAFSS